jgi:RNA polymerase sigma factor (sigma-70 family)
MRPGWLADLIRKALAPRRLRRVTRPRRPGGLLRVEELEEREVLSTLGGVAPPPRPLTALDWTGVEFRLGPAVAGDDRAGLARLLTDLRSLPSASALPRLNWADSAFLGIPVGDVEPPGGGSGSPPTRSLELVPVQHTVLLVPVPAAPGTVVPSVPAAPATPGPPLQLPTPVLQPPGPADSPVAERADTAAPRPASDSALPVPGVPGPRPNPGGPATPPAARPANPTAAPPDGTGSPAPTRVAPAGGADALPPALPPGRGADAGAPRPVVVPEPHGTAPGPGHLRTDGDRVIARAGEVARPQPGLVNLSDGVLLRRFAGNRDQSAFTELVRRHGRSVLATCTRVVGDPDRARDAYQGTFLALARRAHALDGRDSLAGWLHKVAYRMALRVRATAARQRRLERAAARWPRDDANGVYVGIEEEEVWRVLREELARLPEKYREPLVLCYLDGRTHAEVGRALGLPRGSVSKRIGEGLVRLREALHGRGFLV